MSSTRRQSGDGPLRQERFASSPEFERGLMANLVAKRCSVLESAEARDLVWFLQFISHQGGGIKKLAADVCTQFPERIATESMRKFGTKPGQVYSASQVRQVREEISSTGFPLRGDECADAFDASVLLNESEHSRGATTYGSGFPNSYPASDFVNVCHQASEKLSDHLAVLCLDPALPVADGAPWYFPTLFSTLREYQSAWAAANQPKAVTSIGRLLSSALDYCVESRRLVLIDGMPRIGKSAGAKAWCAANPGRARYVECPSTNDDFSFFRAIALSLGVAINLKSKAQELRNRIEEALQRGDLALVLDEAHYLWPQSHFRNTTPGRVNWLMTALVNHGVAVALVTTPQFFRSQKAIEHATCWTSEQFTGRIGHYEKLPDTLTDADLRAVAGALLPDGDERTILALTTYAQSSAKYLAGIDAIVCRARFIARHAGREKILFADVRTAIKESAIPSDAELAKALTPTAGAPRKRAERVFATPVQPGFQVPEIARESSPAEHPAARRFEPDLAGSRLPQFQAKLVPV